MSEELDALRQQVESDPGHPAFPVWVEWLRRQGRLEEALRQARAGLEDAPGRSEGRAALALVQLDAGEEQAARQTLVDAIEAIVGSEVLTSVSVAGSEADSFAGDVEASEIDAAIDGAETRTDEMVSANDIAERALELAISSDPIADGEAERVAAQAGRGAAAAGMERPFGAPTPVFEVAEEVAEEVDGEVDAEVEPLELDAAEVPDVAIPSMGESDARRARVIETLECWLENIRRSAR